VCRKEVRDTHRALIQAALVPLPDPDPEPRPEPPPSQLQLQLDLQWLVVATLQVLGLIAAMYAAQGWAGRWGGI
jgi:hypothetical protein